MRRCSVPPENVSIVQQQMARFPGYQQNQTTPGAAWPDRTTLLTKVTGYTAPTRLTRDIGKLVYKHAIEREDDERGKVGVCERTPPIWSCRAIYMTPSTFAEGGGSDGTQFKRHDVNN